MKRQNNNLLSLYLLEKEPSLGKAGLNHNFSGLCYQLVFLQCFPGRPSLREVFSKLSVKLIPQPRKTMLRSEYLYHLKDAQVWYELSS